MKVSSSRMAQLCLCLIFTIFLNVHYASSRTISSARQMTFLDVSFETQKVQKLFSTDFKAAQLLNEAKESNPFEDSSSTLSFQLHPRLSVEGAASHQDYSSLSLSRLGRDSARVNSIQAHLDRVVQGVVTLTDLKPSEESVSTEGMEMPVVSGVSEGSGEYFSRVGIGHPVSQSYMVLDTGSDINWVQCSPCADCYQQADPIFEPTNSSTYRRLTCRAQQCKSLDVSACVKDTCLYQVSYGDGSYSVGELASETFTFGTAATSAAVNNIAIGCGHDNEGLFTGAAGLLGLGGGGLSFLSQINASSFSYCLVDRDTKSTSTLEFNSVTPVSAVTAPLLRNPKTSTYYYVDLAGLIVGGKAVSIPQSTLQLKDNGDGGVIVDSGTAITRFPTEVYNALRDAFVKGTTDLPLTNGVAVFDTCYDLSKRESVEIPTVSFQFSNGKEWSIPAKNYLVPIDSNGTFCFAFATTSSAMGIIGNVQQQGTRVSFDMMNSLVGFTNDNC